MPKTVQLLTIIEWLWSRGLKIMD